MTSTGGARVALVANPGAGGGGAEEQPAGALRAAGATVTALGLDQLERIDPERHDRVAVAGGDGSIAPVAAAAARAGLPLAVIPTGTANDFARALGLPSDPAAAARLAATGTAVRALDLARLDGRPFVNAASAGLNVPAARAAGRLKGALGPLAYAVGGVRAALLARPIRVEVTADGRPFFAGPAWQVIVASSGAFGGGSDVDPADPDDGLLDVVVIAAGPRARLAVHAYGLRRGRISGQRGVRRARAARVEVTQHGEAAMNVDGELIETARPARFWVDAGAFALVVPSHQA